MAGGGSFSKKTLVSADGARTGDLPVECKTTTENRGGARCGVVGIMWQGNEADGQRDWSKRRDARLVQCTVQGRRLASLDRAVLQGCVLGPARPFEVLDVERLQFRLELTLARQGARVSHCSANLKGAAEERVVMTTTRIWALTR